MEIQSTKYVAEELKTAYGGKVERRFETHHLFKQQRIKRFNIIPGEVYFLVQ